MPRADRVIRLASTVAVLVVAGVAAYVSYFHAVEVITRAGGESSLSAHLLPATVDGLAASASLVMLFAARYKLETPTLARVTLAIALGGTMVVNVLHGVEHGVLASVIAAWPALSLALSWEMAVWIVGAARSMDTRSIITIDKVEVAAREQLTRVVELLGAEPGISGAEVARRLTLSYPLALDLVKEAKALLPTAR